jgi:hypothetical protein
MPMLSAADTRWHGQPQDVMNQAPRGNDVSISRVRSLLMQRSLDVTTVRSGLCIISCCQALILDDGFLQQCSRDVARSHDAYHLCHFRLQPRCPSLCRCPFQSQNQTQKGESICHLNYIRDPVCSLDRKRIKLWREWHGSSV